MMDKLTYDSGMSSIFLFVRLCLFLIVIWFLHYMAEICGRNEDDSTG